jgi:hypothetical protein
MSVDEIRRLTNSLLRDSRADPTFRARLLAFFQIPFHFFDGVFTKPGPPFTDQ